MTTATVPSACPGIRRDGSLENGENRLELGAQVFHRLRGERAPGFGLQLARATILLDLLARAFDRVFLRVQEVLHQHDQLDLAALVHAIAGAVFRGVQKPELTLPIAQHVGLQVGELADFPDGEEFLDGLWDAHRLPPPPSPPHCSAFNSRSIRSAIAWRGGLPSNSTAATCSAIGSSTPCRAPSVTAARAVFTPSATEARPARACDSAVPRASSTPSERLRDSGPVAVRMRSPIPARPAKVAGSAPSATPSRVISASPRVISAARVLWPRPSPSRIPAARAITFLSAPPSSTPSTSVCE